MKRFLVKTSVFALIILLGLTGVNYFGDAAHLFDASYNQEIVDILSQGKNATNLSNYDERNFQRLWINSYSTKPSTIVLGSSRSLDIRGEFIGSDKFRNNSVTGASIQDLIGIYQLYKEQGNLPKKIIINCDPWLLNRNNGRTKWVNIAPEYHAFFGRKFSKEKEDNLYQLISFSYFQASFKNLKKVLKGSSRPHPTLEIDNKRDTKLFDGSLVHGVTYQTLPESEVEKRAKAYILGEVYGISGFDSISTKITDEFEAMLLDMKKNSIQVCLLMSPYHPIVFSEVEKKHKNVLASEVYFQRVAKNFGFPCVGSYNPDLCGLNGTHFFDGMHLTASGMQEFLKQNFKLEE